MKKCKVFIAVLFLLFTVNVFTSEIHANEIPEETVTSEDLLSEEIDVSTEGILQTEDIFNTDNITFEENPVKESKMSFDKTNDRYVFTVDGEEVFYTNVPKNAYVTEPVEIEAKTAVAMVYCGEESYILPKDGIISEPGEYKVEFVCSNPEDAENIVLSVSGVYSTYFSFRILPELVNDLGAFTVPENCYVDSVNFNGQDINLANDCSVMLSKDGEYRIVYCDRLAANKSFTLKFVRDTVAPMLIFDKTFESKMYGPVKYTPSEEDASVKCFFDGNLVTDKIDEITIPGRYSVTVSDKAGNSRNYEFIIIKEYKFFSGGMIFILVGAVLLFLGFVIYIRRNKYEV